MNSYFTSPLLKLLLASQLFFFCSFVYILVSHDSKLKPSKSEASHSYREAADRGLVYYVTTALDYAAYNASNIFTLGNGITTTGLNGQEFQNAKLSFDEEYYYFIRVYSAQYTPEVSVIILLDIKYVIQFHIERPSYLKFTVQ